MAADPSMSFVFSLAVLETNPHNIDTRKALASTSAIQLILSTINSNSNHIGIVTVALNTLCCILSSDRMFIYILSEMHVSTTLQRTARLLQQTVNLWHLLVELIQF